MNVLLIVLDSVRARNTSLHGHANRTTPFLESFADRATVYGQARSPGTWSLPSHVSMFTGSHVAEHGLSEPTDRLEPGRTVFDELREAGYETGVFSENPFLTVSDCGLSEAFDAVEGPRNLPFPDALDPTEFVQRRGQGNYAEFVESCLRHDRPLRSIANGALVKLAWDYPSLLPERFEASTAGDVYVDLLLDWIDRRSGRWAACVNLMDAHLPYQPDDEHDLWGGAELRRLQDGMDDQVWDFFGGRRPWWQREALTALYDGTIRQMDAQIERLVGALADRGELDETLVVVTSDHGEGFGEPSRVRPERIAGHGPGIHEELLHVPLLVRFPGQESGRRIDDPASLTNFPRVVRRAREGDADPAAFTDETVVASFHGLAEQTRRRALQYCDDLEHVDGHGRAVYRRAADGDGVDKYVSWDGAGATIRVRDDGVAYVTAADDGGVPSSTFDGFGDAGIKRSDGSDIDDSTMEHLEDLGYA